MGDRQYHRTECARIVVELIVEANRGTWPRNVRQWGRVARRFGATIVLEPRARRPCYYEGLIILPWPVSRRQLHLWLAHECAEAALLWDGRPPYRMGFAGHASEAHEISRLVEEAVPARRGRPRRLRDRKPAHRAL